MKYLVSFIRLLYNPECFVLRYDTNFSGLGTPDLICREFRAFNPEIVGKFFNSVSSPYLRKDFVS
jgi:hypothetical protein